MVLIGAMGSGKSSLLRKLAAKMGRRGEDTDRIVARKTGQSIAALFDSGGESHFRDLETAALRSLTGENNLVIATGGGIVARHENRTLLRQLGVVVWLTAREDVLFERVSRDRRRPLLHTPDPRATVHQLLESREPLYRECADLTVDTSDDSHAVLAATILATASAFITSTARSPDAELAPP